MKRRSLLTFACTIFVGVVAAHVSYAAVVIDEIMYDLKDGGDTGREWIEVLNTGNASVDISTWRFAEADTNHKLTLVEGDALLSSGGFAVIVDDPTKFLEDNPGFSGMLFDSSFSLSNTGETLMLRDESLADVDSVSYVSTQGGSGDGNSLQLINGVWQGSSPTPGAANPALGQNQPTEGTSDGTTQATTDAGAATTAASNGSSFPVEPQIFADAGPGTRTAIVGADVTFEGRVWGLKQEPIINARMAWNFGDGGFKDGQSVAHRYMHPGAYIVVLDAASGYYAASDRMTVTVIPAELSLTAVHQSPGGFVTLANNSKVEVDLSSWILRAGTAQIFIPKHTLIAAKGALTFSEESTGLIVSEQKDVALLYPNGEVAVAYGQSPIVASAAALSVQAQPSITSRVAGKTTTSESAQPITQAASLAAVGGVGERSGAAPLWVWLLGVTALAAVGVAAVVIVRNDTDDSALGAAPSADDFEIIEQKDDEKIPF